MKLALLLLLLLPGCTFSGGGYGINAAWTIGDASVKCTYDEDGLPQGDDCQVSGPLTPAELELLAGEGDESPPVSAE